MTASDLVSMRIDGGWDFISLEDDEPSASKYIDFANADLADKDSERTRANAVSNAKRALHRRVDALAEALGFEHSLNPRNDFPTKAAFCTRCGITTPRILTKLNRVRNAVEHDYYLPTRDESENFVDVVLLFLASTQRLVDEFPTGVEFSSYYRDFGYELLRSHLEVTFALKRGKLTLQIHEANLSSADVHSLALTERKLIRKSAKNGTSSRLDLDKAVRIAVEKKITMQHTKLNLSVAEGEPFFEWVSGVISAIR
jgi:hypothetical protein